MSSVQALAHKWLDKDAPPSPNALMSGERRPVKQLLFDFNAQRMLAKVVKGSHRRVAKEGTPEAVPPT